MKNLFVWAAAALAVAALPAVAPAQEQDPQAIADSLQYQSGTIPLGDNLATLTLPPALHFLDAAGTRTLLVDLWGNPPKLADGRMGAILPAGISPLSNERWALIITYEDSGHVTDDDAASINYDDLLKEMQESIKTESEARAKEGFESYELLGWAAPPRYDSQAKKLHWAQELRFAESPDNTLNYEIRVLGRSGVLDLNIVSSMDQLPAITPQIDTILGTVAFNPGNRYDEYQEGIDKVAEYGIAGLIAGGVLAKAGFFKLLIAALAAGWKFIAAGVAIVGGAVIRFFRRKPAGES
jgi:uncharacterized membrane-anchored protein